MARPTSAVSRSTSLPSIVSATMRSVRRIIDSATSTGRPLRAARDHSSAVASASCTMRSPRAKILAR